MFTKRQVSWLTLIACIATAITISAAQIEFRSRDFEPKAGNYNYKIGNLELDLKYELGVIYDSNTNRSSTESTQESGTKFVNALGVNADWPVSPHLTLQSGVTLGYIWFPNGDGADGFQVNGSDQGAAADFAVDLRVGQNGLLTLNDKISRGIDTIELSRNDNKEEFSEWQNVVSLQYQNQLSSQISTAVKISRQDTWAAKSDFDFRNNIQNAVDGVLLWQMNSRLYVGPFVRYSTTEYFRSDSAGNKHNDIDIIEFGLKLESKIADQASSTLILGYQDQDIKDKNNLLDTNQEDGYTADFRLSHQVTESVNHNFSASFTRTLGQSTTINFSEDFESSYSFNWRLAEEWEIKATVLNFLKTNESSRFGEIAEVYTNEAQLVHQFTPKSKARLAYQRTEKFSNLRNRDYERNQILLIVEHDF